MATYTTAAHITNYINKGDVITVITAKGDVTGAFISVNTKGVNVNVDGKVISRSLVSITDVRLATPVAPTTPADLFTDEGAYGAAAIAAALEMDAYDLRVILRDLGYGVGKGRVYTFDMGDANNVVRAVRNYVATETQA